MLGTAKFISWYRNLEVVLDVSRIFPSGSSHPAFLTISSLLHAQFAGQIIGVTEKYSMPRFGTYTWHTYMKHLELGSCGSFGPLAG